MGTLYLLTFRNGKKYIGQTIRSIAIRMAQHRYVSKRRNSRLYAAWRAHGEPSLTVLGEFPNAELAKREQEAIAAHDSLVPRGYNSTIGGESAPSRNPLIAEKISAALKGRKKPPLSEEHRRKLSEANKQRTGPNKGRVFSDEWRRRLGAAGRGRKRSAISRQKQSAALKGRVFSDEWRKKLSAARKAWWGRHRLNTLK